MQIEISNTKQLGAVLRRVRKSQKMQIELIGMLTGNAHNTVSAIEKGQATSEVGRVLRLLEATGIKIHLDLPDSVEPDSELAQIIFDDVTRLTADDE